MSKSSVVPVQKKPLTCVIVEDDDEERDLFRALATLSGIHVVADVADGRTAIAVLLSKKPDFVLLDLRLPLLSGIEVIAAAKPALPKTKFVVLTGWLSEESIRGAFAAGASGYLDKTDWVACFPATLADVIDDMPVLSKTAVKVMVDSMVRDKPQRGETKLTERQKEVVCLVVKGWSSRTVADHLHISVRTVEKHRSEAMKALGVHSATELVRYAVRTGLAT